MSGAMSSLDVHPVIDEGDYYTEVNGCVVPQNIRHRFRSSITSELLSDSEKVARDRYELESIHTQKKTPTIIYRRSQTALAPTNPDYAKISSDLRSVVGYGHPVQRRSHSKTVHNDEIFKDIEQVETKSNLNRRKKDWLGRWMEANVIRDRLYKGILEAQKKATQ